MDSQYPATIQNQSPEDRRRSKRFPLVVPVALKWIGLDGLPVGVEGRAVEGSNHGGLLELAEHPPFGKEAALTNLLSRQTVMVQVLSLRTTSEGKVRGLAVQFLSPPAAFWGAVGLQGKLNAEFQASSSHPTLPPRPSRWKALLQLLLGRPSI